MQKRIFTRVFVIVTICFDKCFSHVITGRHIAFCKSLLLPWGLFNRRVLKLFEISFLEKVRISSFISTIRVQYLYQNKKLLKKLHVILVTFYALLLTFDASLFSLLMKYLRSSKPLWKRAFSNTIFFSQVVYINWEQNHRALGYKSIN